MRFTHSTLKKTEKENIIKIFLNEFMVELQCNATLCIGEFCMIYVVRQLAVRVGIKTTLFIVLVAAIEAE